MNKNLFCPNLNLPENKALVEKLGLFGFYREYVKHDFNIPNEVYEDLADTSKTVEDLIYINKELFSKSQQDEIVDSILYQVQQYRLDGESNVNTIKNNVLNDFKETAEYFKEDSSEEAVDLVRNLNNVIDNYDKFFSLVNKKLASQDVTVDTNDISDFNNEESSYDSAENLNQKLNYSDESSFKQSSKDTASANLKIALSLIPKYVYENGDIVLDSEGNFETELSFIGSPTFESLDTIWNDLLYTLIDVPIGSKLDYLDNSNNPRHRMIAYHIKNNPDTSLINQFESVFSKQQAKFVTVVYSRPDKSGVKSIKVLDTNRLNADNLLIDVWYESFLNSPYVTSINGNKFVDTQKGKELLAEYNNVLNTIKTDLDKGLKDTRDLLNKIGINVSLKALQSEGIWINENLNTPVQIINNNLKYIFNKLAGDVQANEETEDVLELNNPFVDENSTLNLLSKLENKANPNTFEASFIGGDGKARYSFVNNTYASHKIRQLKTDLAYLNKLKTTAYASGSFYLNKLITDPNFRNIFDLFYVDSLGNDSNNQENKTFARMNTKEKELTKIALFQNAGRGTTAKDANIGQFIGLVPSDKTTTPIFKTLKVNVKPSSSVDENGNYTFNMEAMEVIYDQFISEYNRVKQTFKEIGDPDIRQIDQYHTGAQMGKRFIVFPFMNSLLIQNNELLELDDIRIKEIVKPRLQKFLSDLTKDQIKYWKEIGIYPNADNYNNFFDKSYMSKIGINIPSKPLKDENETNQSYTLRLITWKNSINPILPRYSDAFAANYAVNQFVFMMNQTQLISGDPALHGKSIIRDLDPDSGSAYSKTWVNFYKRMAKDIAPGTDGNFGENSNYNTIFLKDLNYSSEQLMNYMEKISADIGQNYAEINPADAQEYTTLDEHLEVMRAYGRLNQEMEEAAQRLKEGGSDINDIQLILQPMKPVYVNSQIEGGVNVMYYIKSSSFPLIPALTKGLEIDKLRQFMESNNIQRAAYESAAKLGISGNPSEVSNDGVKWSDNLDINKTTVINLSRSGFRLQQEMPYHGTDGNINEGSQGRKLVLNNLDYAEVINYNGKQYTGNEVKNIFERLHIEKMDRSLNQLITDLGFNLETGRLDDISKIHAILQEEAENRNYPIADLYSIQLIEEDGKLTFKVPLSFTNNATRFESILNSLFTNRVLRSELPGFMGIQGASSGFQKVITDQDLSGSIIESGITWLDPNDTKLNYIREDDNGDILSADILVPNYLGVKLSDYILEDGTLDTDKLPEDILTIIGLRIPTQGYNSMMKFKVKGFLPDIVGDLVIVPAEVTVQMGSDFDVDKLFIYRYHFKKLKDGSIKKITTTLPDNAADIDYSSLSTKQIDNLIIQTFEDRLSDKRLMDQILTPNGFGKLPEVAAEVSKLTSKSKSAHTFSTREQNSISDINTAGKMGTAQFSLFSTFFKAAQDAGLKSAYGIKIKNSKDEVVELSSLSDVNNIEGNKRSDVIMYLQSAAVDNAKEQILGNLNINDYTMGVAGTMAMLGLPEDFIGYFLSQPSLREYSSRIANANDIISGAVDPSASTRIIRELISERLKSTKDLTSETKLKIANIPFGVKELRQNIISNNTDNLNLTQFTPEELTVISQVDDLFQFSILNKFEILLELASNIQALQSAINTDTKGLGASYSAIQAKVMQVQRLFSNPDGGVNSEGYPILNAHNLVINNTVSKANETLFKANELLGNLYTYNSASYINIINTILTEASLSPTESNLKDIYNNLKSFILTNPELLNLEEINTVRDRLLYSEDNLAERWAEYSNSPEGKRNPLTKRITPKFAKNNEDYNGVKAVNTPASNNSHDIDNMLGYFYDMLNSSNINEKKLAEDLVRYHILTGAQYGSQSIGKYITYDVLEKYDFSKKLRNIDKLLRSSQVFDSFVRQYFQNNPFKATTFDIEEIGGAAGEVVVVPINNNPLRNKDNETVAYFSVYDASSRSPILYERSNISPSHIEYTKIPVLGNKFIKKYNYLDNNGGSYNIPSREVLPKTTDIATNISEDLTTTEYIDSRYGGNSISEVLDNIKNKSSNPYFRKISSDLLNSNVLNGVNFEYSTDRLANGWFTNNTIYINPDAIKSTGKDILDKFEEVFLHELLHAGTVNSIDNYDSLNDAGKKAVKKINRLFTEYSNSYENQEELARYKEINTRRLAGNNSITSEERQFLVDNKAKLYHLVSVEEFIAAGLTNPDVTSDLKSKNLFTRLLEFIADLLGINSNDLEFLYQSTIELVGNNQTQSNNISTFTNHSGGAKGGDAYWDSIGREFGVQNHNHYRPNDYVNASNRQQLNEQYLETVKFLGRGVISEESYAGKLVRRDMIQANNADSVIGVTELIAPGIKGRKGYNNKKNYIVPEGGTGYAVARGILSNKPTYVYNQSSNYGVEQGWYKWQNNNFIKTETPILTNNFAGIGTQEINEFGISAIRDVYQKTVKSLSNDISEDLFTGDNEYNRLEFVRQRDEFLRAHKTFIGKRITDNTLQKFIKSQQSKAKYNRLKISSWNGELRISRVDPIYEDLSEGKQEKESPKDRAINSLIERLKDSLKRFNRRKTQLGDEVDPVLDSKISKLESRIKELEGEKSISNYMRISESKINDIIENIDSYDDVESVNDALSYTSALNRINEALEFTSEFDEWNDRLDNISAKASKLNKKLLKKASELMTDVIKSDLGIDYNVSQALNKGLKDVGFGESMFLDPSQSSSSDIQVIGYMIERYQFEANQEHDAFNEEFIPLIEEYRNKYKNDYSPLLQLDSKGKPTGFLLNKYRDEFYKQAVGKKEYKFSDIEFTEEGKKRYEKELKSAYDNLSPEDYLAWEANNNPYTYMEAWKLGKKSKQTGARRFLTITPKKEWIDPNYTKLKSLPESDPARRLYEFIEPILRRNNKRYGQQANYIPELQKSASELLLEGKAKESFKGLKEDFAETFSNEDKVVEKGDIDILTGEPRLYIPKSMFNNELRLERKSFDLAAITEKVRYQEISLKYKYQAEPVLNLYYAILKGSNQFLRYDEDGNPITINKPATRLLEHSQFMIQNYLYNKNRTISDTENKLGKITDRLIDYTRVIGMGWNPFSAIGNITQGLTSNFTFASGNQFFNKKECTKATSLMMHTLAGNTNTAKKISNMFVKFDAFVKTNELNYGKSKELASATQSKYKTLLEPYDMQQKGEYFIQGQTMIGILLNTKIETPNGDKISLFDGYDENGKWKSEYGEDPMKDKDKLFKMTQRIRKAIIDVHGNYSRPIQAKKDFYWRAAMIFRTWLPQAINTRFGEETTDVLLGTTTKGRYRSYGSLFKDSEGKIDLGALRENIKYLIGLSGNTSMSEIDKVNMRKNIAELAMIVAISLAVMALKAGLEDLDDEEKLYTTYIINSMSRVNGELTFFMLPSSFKQISQDPIPLMRTLDQTIDLLPASWNYIIGEDEYKAGVRKGRSKLGKEITDLIPAITQLDKNWTYMNQVFDN